MRLPNENTIDAHVVEAYGRNLRTEPQEMRSLLVPYTDNDLNFTEPGDSWSDYSLGPRQMKETEGRWGDTPNYVGERKKRTGYFKLFEDGERFDNVDRANALHDPRNKTMLNMRYAVSRARDIAVWKGAFGSVNEGEEGGVVKAFPAKNDIGIQENTFYKGKADGAAAPAAVDTPMTPAKARAAKVKLDLFKMPGKRIMTISSEQLGNMLTSVETTSADYAHVKALNNGEITKWLGFDWVTWEDCPDDTETIQYCGAWIAPAVQYRSRPIVDFFLGQLPTKKLDWQAYHKFRQGAMRIEDAVVRIACKRNSQF